ncbi:Similar to Transcription activator of gluconeogenesis acuK; acc. no. A2QFG8 [Pyronema omphalodes CBS 100304]|uniref:Similar to Transcription activator of gluconeogenesis acuK acc. no. A2QFG8 n=1 Tax=Pyronema omphalodes (strain CBS 100304) TaxID=1076935 RepID=U4LMQ6_PYROM|nr:Similar to Transcription activator of gluconeogenesis acuK; acc. no. A2QFG8 [Pyronema omphalodes CBS 100304]
MMVKSEPSPVQTPTSLPSSNNPTNGSNGNSVGAAEPQSQPPSSQASSAAQSSATRSNAKDPSRPRRKKARRACFACQRAHLTCGDERPCQRCIKRGLQEQCHDGVRKKAKYLHDAPIDDGPPEFAPQPTSSQSGQYAYPHHHPQPPSITTDMLPPDGTINPNTIESPGGALVDQQQAQAFSQAPMFDPSDPALFNFDIASLNFGSHYGALEFGVLGQMSGGGATVGTPDNNNSGPGSTYGYSPGVGGGDSYVGFPAPQDSTMDSQWGQSRASRQSAASQGDGGGFANTYMIEAGPGSLTSPSPPVESPRQGFTPTPATTVATTYASEAPAPLGSPSTSFFNSTQNRPTQPSTLQQVQSASHQMSAHIQPQQQHAALQRRRRPDDPSQIYTQVTQPYPYALQHHRLFHMLETRFPKPSLLRIARAMAAFRPSFIACTQTLKAEDLLFMEKCFQRTLWEYERFIQSCGTPTIVCRRTGEVVGVGKEFCMLTGWERTVLLGEKRNLNTNRPFIKPPNAAPGLLQPPPDDGVKRPVFLAELLDDDSVLEFYEKFSQLAFGDSRGAVMTTCKVLTYQPPQEEGEERKPPGLAGKEGKVDCAFCWTIKRDVFDIPMLIVGNVSKCWVF